MHIDIIFYGVMYVPVKSSYLFGVKFDDFLSDQHFWTGWVIIKNLNNSQKMCLSKKLDT